MRAVTTMILILATVATTYARKNLDGPVQRLQIYLLAVLHVVMVLLLEVKNVTQSQVVSLVRLTLDSHALAMFARPHAAMVLRQVMRHVTTTILILEMAAMDHAKRKLDGSAQRQMTCQRVWPRVVMGMLLELKSAIQLLDVLHVWLTLDSLVSATSAHPHAVMESRQVMRTVTTTIQTLEMAVTDYVKKNQDGHALKPMICLHAVLHVVTPLSSVLKNATTCLVVFLVLLTLDSLVCNVCSSTCGDGVKASDEACDDNDTDPGDGCDGSCQEEIGWTCSETADLSSCTIVCGDTILTGSEECDDGNLNPNDGCNSLCQEEVGWQCSPVCSPFCGDSLVRGDEQCDSVPGCTEC